MTFHSRGSAAAHSVRALGLSSRGSNVYDANASLNLRIPINRQWVPYATLGSSVLWNGHQHAKFMPEANV